MKKYYFLVIFFAFNKNISASAATNASLKKDEPDIAAFLNANFKCEKCGPVLAGHYRIEIKPTVHVVYPSNEEFIRNCNRCPNQCMLQKVSDELKKSTMGRLSLVKLDRDGKKIFAIKDAALASKEKVDSEYTTQIEGQSLGPKACVLILNDAQVLYCYSETHALHKLMDLDAQKANSNTNAAQQTAVSKK